MESYHKKKIGSIPKDSTGGSSIRKGMVVFNGGTSETGLVGDVTGNCVSVPVRMTAGRELVTDDAVMFLNDCREASAEQKIAPPTPAERRPSSHGTSAGVYVRNLSMLPKTDSW